jgi:hypothetical protein
MKIIKTITCHLKSTWEHSRWSFGNIWCFQLYGQKKNSPNFPNLGCLYMNLPIEIIKEIDYTTMSCWYIEYKKWLGNINLLYPVKHKYQSFIEMGEISNE